MSKIFDLKKAALEGELQAAVRRSKVLALHEQRSLEDEYRVVIAPATRTLVSRGVGDVTTAGPVVIGIRYHERFLGEAPHPLEVATVLAPRGIFHPNANPVTGAICCGHLVAAFTLEPLLHLLWAGLNLNVAKAVDTRPGNIVNPAAAQWVIANAHRLPITAQGLWEEP